MRIAIQRWYSSYTREDPLDTVLDCCSALEAAINLPDELRLRISLSVYHTLAKNRKRAFSLVYEMYRNRNDFIHGGRLPELSSKQQQNYIEVVAQVLYRYVDLGKIPDSKSMSKAILRQYAIRNGQ